MRSRVGRCDQPARNNVVLVTSAVPGEGKTFTSLNLALSIVRDREMRVVLVDGDVARPGSDADAGTRRSTRPQRRARRHERWTSDAVTYQTDVDGLFFVPAGNWHDHSPEFFAGSRMPQVIDELSRRVGNGVIIFDSPPLLATNDAQALRAMSGRCCSSCERTTPSSRRSSTRWRWWIDSRRQCGAEPCVPVHSQPLLRPVLLWIRLWAGTSPEDEPGKGNA